MWRWFKQWLGSPWESWRGSWRGHSGPRHDKVEVGSSLAQPSLSPGQWSLGGCYSSPSCRLRASDIMEPNLTYVYPHTRIQSLVSILRTTVHHAFPVVTENRGNEKDFMKGNQLISNNIKFKVREKLAHKARPARKTSWPSIPTFMECRL